MPTIKGFKMIRENGKYTVSGTDNFGPQGINHKDMFGVGYQADDFNPKEALNKPPKRILPTKGTHTLINGKIVPNSKLKAAKKPAKKKR